MVTNFPPQKPQVTFFSCLILLLTLIFVTPSSALAQKTTLTVSPAILENTLDPGQTRTMEVTLFNTTDLPLGIKSMLAPFTLSPQDALTTPSARYDASSWIQVEPADLIIPVGKTATVKITATAPENIGPGGHYATVFFEPVAEVATDQITSSTIAARVGVLVLLTVAGDVHQAWSLDDLTNTVMAKSSQVIFTAHLTNSGNVHLLPTANLHIQPIWGQQESNLTFQPALVMPGTTKMIQAVWPDPPSAGIYQVTATVMTGQQTDQSQSITKQMIIIVRLIPVFVTLCIGLTGLVIVVTLSKYILNTLRK